MSLGNAGSAMSSHGNAAVEVVNLALEELPQLGPLCLQCRGQQTILDGEHLVVDVDVFHLGKGIQQSQSD